MASMILAGADVDLIVEHVERARAVVDGWVHATVRPLGVGGRRMSRFSCDTGEIAAYLLECPRHPGRAGVGVTATSGLTYTRVHAWTVANGGVIPVLTSAERTAISAYEGMVIWYGVASISTSWIRRSLFLSPARNSSSMRFRRSWPRKSTANVCEHPRSRSGWGHRWGQGEGIEQWVTSSTFLTEYRVTRLREALEHAYAMGVDNGVRGGRDYATASLDRCVEMALTAFDVLGGSR